MPGDSVTDLAVRITAGVGFIVFFSWMLFIREREAKRLFGLKKLYGLTKRDDETELWKTKLGLVIGYSAFLALTTLMTSYFVVQLWSKLYQQNGKVFFLI